MVNFSVPLIPMDLVGLKDFEKRGASLEAISYGGTTSPPQIAEKLSRVRDGKISKYVLYSWLFVQHSAEYLITRQHRVRSGQGILNPFVFHSLAYGV